MRACQRFYSCILLIFVAAGVGGRTADAEQYDLLLKGGHVIDPAQSINGPMDVAIAEGKIDQVQQYIPADDAKNVIDVDDLYVVPGLIDAHAHVYAGTGARDVYAGDRSVYPDGHTFRAGVTTVVDAGTSGWRNFPDFKRRVIDGAQTRVLAWLNIVGAGMVDRASQQKWYDMHPQAVAAMVKKFPALIVGIKTAHYDGPEWIAVDRAIEAGRLTNLPVMVDFGAFLDERPFQELVLEKLRPGDTYTHMFYEPVPILDRNGKLHSYLHDARQRGVQFDLGHGRDSFLWAQAIPAVRQGWVPDTISTDLHVGNMNAGMKDMSTCMSKFLVLGVPLEKVIRMSTVKPAALIRRDDLGTLRRGSVADVAVLRLLNGNFGYLDARNSRFRGNQRLQCELTLREGEIVWDLNGLAGQDVDLDTVFSANKQP